MNRAEKTSASYMEIQKENQEVEVAITVRDYPPEHYMLKVESFSLLSRLLLQLEEEKYESEVFEAGAYKWLVLYPSGNKERDGDGHVSLFLKIVETQTLPLGWMVDVNFKLFVYDHIQDKYYAYHDSNGKPRRFHAMRTELGFPKLLRREDFNNTSNGFLVEDSCVFGAEVFVVNYTGHGECISTTSCEENRYTWKIENFSQLNVEGISSDKFIAAEREWTLVLHPQGSCGEAISLFLELRRYLKRGKVFTRKKGKGRLVYAQFTLLIRDQDKGNHFSITDAASFKKGGWGYDHMMSLKDLKDPLNSFLVNDTLIVDVTVNKVSVRVKNQPLK